MTTIKTPAHLLKPGDRIRLDNPDEAPLVVLCAAHMDPGPVGLQLGRLGDIPPHLDRVATVSWAPMFLANVETPDLTPAQARADDLAAALRNVLRPGTKDETKVRAIWERGDQLLRELVPPDPPTLEEVLAVLDQLCNDGAVGSQLNAAERLLNQARAAGVLPRG